MSKEKIGLRNEEVKRKIRKITENEAVNNKVIKLIDLNNEYFGEKELEINKQRLTIFCGCNGSGKSRLISSIHKILMTEDAEDLIYHEGSMKPRKSITKNIGNIIFFDTHTSSRIKDFYKERFDASLLEFSEYRKLGENEVEIISHITNRGYDSIEVLDIDASYVDADIAKFSIGGQFPYYRVKFANITYESSEMGTGEHSLFYLYSLLTHTKNNILFLEEPENFLSPICQKRFMDYLVNNIVVDNSIVYVTTHSPTILRNVPPQLIQVLYNLKGKTEFYKPEDVSIALSQLGLESNYKGIILVEDSIGRDFIEYILRIFGYKNISREYLILPMGGEGNIQSIINLTPNMNLQDFKIVPLYDGDMNGKITNPVQSMFLPGQKAFETEARDIMMNSIEEFSIKHNIEKKLFELSLAKHGGEEKHEWLHNLPKEIEVKKDVLIEFVLCKLVEKYEIEVNSLRENISEMLC